jgi:DNA-binding response OmpR family regulator
LLVLLIEDNRTLAANIIEYIESYGFECDYADNGNLGFELAQNHDVNVIILDLMLPGKNGISICQQLRALGINTPILMLTARDTLADKLEGFNAGTDDYLVKPFDLPELIARVQVLAKRTKIQSQAILQVDDLVMNISSHEVSRAGQFIHLSKACWNILEALLKASPNILTRHEIANVVWPDQLPDSDVLKSHIYQLRQQIDKPFSYSLIETVRGVGLSLKGRQKQSNKPDQAESATMSK